jgi:hypothetical protein
LISIDNLFVHIMAKKMTEVAPLEQWTLNSPRECDKLPFSHACIVDGVTFFTLTDKPIEVES